VELGEVQKLTCGDGADHFDADTSPHYHFVCKGCGQVSDIPLQTLPDINELAQEYAGGHVDSHNIFFYGTCNGCLEKNSQ
jgi:Fur family peroxide stress response transcriptional regulator